MLAKRAKAFIFHLSTFRFDGVAKDKSRKRPRTATKKDRCGAVHKNKNDCLLVFTFVILPAHEIMVIFFQKFRYPA